MGFPNERDATRVVDVTATLTAGNPETVSTDFDESDRLYFEELSHDAWESGSPRTRGLLIRGVLIQ